MHNVFKGIMVGFIGLIVWVLFSIPAGIDAALGTTTPPLFEAFMAMGFAVMVGGPVVYIVVLPVAGWLRSRRARDEVRTPP